MLVFGTAYVLWRSAAKRNVEAKLAAIRAAGEPTNGEELNQFYRLPDGMPDTADAWLEVVGPFCGPGFIDEDVLELPMVGSCEDDIPPPGQPWDKLEAAEAILAKHQSSIDRMHQVAAKKGAGRYPVDFREGLLRENDCATDLLEGVRMLRLQTHVVAHRGDSARVVESLLAIHGAAESMRFEPSMLSQLFRMGMNGIVYQDLNAVLPHVDFSDAQLKTLSDVSISIDYREGTRLAFVGDRAIGIEAFLDRNKYIDESIRADMGSFSLPIRYDDLSFYLDCMTPMVAATQLPAPRDREVLRKQIDDLDETASQGGWRSIRYAHTFLLVPSSRIYLRVCDRVAAQRDATLTSIAIQRYRLEHPALPEKLEELVPAFLDAVPTDPFDGEPIRYRVDEDRYTVYSVGPDGVDDGGHVALPESRNEPPDVGFAVPMVVR